MRQSVVSIYSLIQVILEGKVVAMVMVCNVIFSNILVAVSFIWWRCNNIPEAVNKLAWTILVKLGEIDMTPKRAFIGFVY
jgi:hypothetical protein